MRATTRGLARIGLVVVASAFALEFALQVLALVLALTHVLPGDAPAAGELPGDHRVLCVGDSFTYGMGASDRSGSYPAQLERLLGEHWQVVNAGRPGMDSRAVLEELDANLRRHRPQFVCVMVGVNDSWRRRGLASRSRGAEGGFELRWRTGDLFAVLLHGWGLFADRAQPVATAPSPIDPQHPLIGMWVDVGTGSKVFFAADGIAEFGGARLPWSVTTGALLLGPSAEQRRMSMTFRDGGVVLQADDLPPMLLVHDTSLSTDQLAVHATIARMFAAYDAERWADAVAAGRAALAGVGLTVDDELDVLARLAHAETLVGGNEPQVAAHLERLRQLHAERHDERSRSMLALALTNACRFREALSVLDVDPTNETSLTTLDLVNRANAAAQVLTQDEALAVVDRAIVTARTRGEVPGALWLARYRALQSGDRRSSVRALIRAWRAMGAMRELTDLLRQQRACEFGEGLLREIAAEEGMAGEATDAFVMRWRAESGVDLGDAWIADLRSNLLQIVQRGHDAGAVVILATYPFEGPNVNGVVREITQGSGRVAFVDNALRFQSEHAVRETHFVADGHCSDAGYSLIANEFALWLGGRQR